MTTVRSQAELDAAINGDVRQIIIDSPEGVWLTIRESRESEIDILGSSCIEEIGGSATVQRVGDSATVQRVGGSATVQRVGGSATVQRVGDSATVQSVGDSATVQRARGAAVVRLYDRARLVESTGGVHAFVHSARVTVGGDATVINMTERDLTDVSTWLDWHGVDVEDGKATLYKGVDNAWRATNPFPDGSWPSYAPGETVTAPDWQPGNSCGQGLHLSPSPAHTLAYHSAATRFVAVEVDVAGIVVIGDKDDADKVKVQSCRVLGEVNIAGEVAAVIVGTDLGDLLERFRQAQMSHALARGAVS